jgi:hypothetical protein
MSRPVASMIRNPSSPSRQTKAKSFGLGESRAMLSIASNCRWLSPSVGDRVVTGGRRTCSAGECANTPSMTQVR